VDEGKRQKINARYVPGRKHLVGVEFEKWLEDDEHLDVWENGKLPAWEKRVLITKFVGGAWELMSTKYNLAQYFEKTGNLLTLDGSEDAKVNIEGLPNYKPPPPECVIPTSPIGALEVELGPEPNISSDLESDSEDDDELDLDDELTVAEFLQKTVN
jgi:hypothetical protein